MKCYPLIFFLSYSIISFSQKIEKFYDYRFKETVVSNARFYAILQKTDSGWMRNEYYIRENVLHMKGFYLDTACKIPSGQFYYFHPNGNLLSIGKYLNGAKDGVWLRYNSDGTLNDSTTYYNGNPVGTSLKWHRTGFLSDSAVLNPDGSGIGYSWFDNGSPSFAGLFEAGHKMIGKWKYFHKNGQVSAVEIFEHGHLVDKTYFDEQGIKMIDTTTRDSPAIFMGKRGKESTWTTYLAKNLSYPIGYQIINADKAVVVVNAVIDEDGKVQDVELSTAFHPTFDKLALQVVRKSPDWKPAISHNRRVKYFFKQPMFFGNNPE